MYSILSFRDDCNRCLVVSGTHIALVLQTWICEKMKVVESTDELGDDLAGVMALQRRLAGMQKDLDAIQSKVGTL